MTSVENLILVASEEASELSQAVDKLLRFGPKGHSPYETPDKTNEYHVMKEFYHICEMIDMLREQGVIRNLPIPDEVEIRKAKREAVMKYLQVSRDIGTVTD